MAWCPDQLENVKNLVRRGYAAAETEKRSDTSGHIGHFGAECLRGLASKDPEEAKHGLATNFVAIGAAMVLWRVRRVRPE